MDSDIFSQIEKESIVNISQISQTKQENLAAVSPIISRVRKMSLDEKIGQMLIIGFEHQYLDDHIRNMITRYHIGGVNLLGRNVRDKNQVKQLIADLQRITTIPLFIATDQEGGKVTRFNFLSELTPQITIRNNRQAEQIAINRAKELRGLGVNMNFSPVLDYVSDSKSYLYNRTFGTKPVTTGELGSAMIKGYRKGGIIPVAKHFPGYGNIFPDPHKNQATLDIDSEELESNLIPFREVIDDNSAIAIMTAHILIPEIDERVATLSSEFLNEILRKRLGFNGVIITDDLEMISVGKTIEQSAVDAVEAGADIIISTYTPEKQIRIFNSLKNSVLNDGITEERINESVVRILNLKIAFGFSP
ncbi:MAG: glycoside hydrolase family 3 protein [Candidatus Vogelbacteria bacterium]|nr:glycoside hydrolase family 3 protein [Candidatus Vogelbacteria bacterium]